MAKVTKSPFSDDCAHFSQNIGGARVSKDPLLRTFCTLEIVSFKAETEN